VQHVVSACAPSRSMCLNCLAFLFAGLAPSARSRPSMRSPITPSRQRRGSVTRMEEDADSAPLAGTPVVARVYELDVVIAHLYLVPERINLA
jgi:hypothetical protein